MQKNRLSIFFAMVLTLVITISVIQDGSLSISNAILAITALIILWYSYETAIMRKEMVKQNMMVMRPVINLKLNDNKVYFKNEGSGPALNIRVADFNQMILNKTAADNNSSCEIHPVSYIAQSDIEEMIIYRINLVTGEKSDVSQPDIFFGVGKQVQLTILYTDIEDTKYETKIKTSSGNIEHISFNRQS